MTFRITLRPLVTCCAFVCISAASGRASESIKPPVIAWGPLSASPVPSTLIPRDIVAVYIDGAVIECEGRALKREELATFVSGAAKQRKARQVLLFFTSDTRLGRLTEILEALRKSTVSQITINGDPIPAGFRFRG